MDTKPDISRLAITAAANLLETAYETEQLYQIVNEIEDIDVLISLRNLCDTRCKTNKFLGDL